MLAVVFSTVAAPAHAAVAQAGDEGRLAQALDRARMCRLFGLAFGAEYACEESLPPERYEAPYTTIC